jgi:hypothetical protein
VTVLNQPKESLPDRARDGQCERFHEESHDVVAFITSMALGLLGFGAGIFYGKRRKVGAPLSWGEAMVAATFVFLMAFWWYGVVPNTFLAWADNELGWRSDKFLIQSGQEIFGISFLDSPTNVTYIVVRDILVMGVYGLGVALHLFGWAWWQDRAKAKPAVVPASRYGRPLVRKG